MKNPLKGDDGWAILWRITVMLAVGAILLSWMI